MSLIILLTLSLCICANVFCGETTTGEENGGNRIITSNDNFMISEDLHILKAPPTRIKYYKFSLKDDKSPVEFHFYVGTGAVLPDIKAFKIGQEYLISVSIINRIYLLRPNNNTIDQVIKELQRVVPHLFQGEETITSPRMLTGHVPIVSPSSSIKHEINLVKIFTPSEFTIDFAKWQPDSTRVLNIEIKGEMLHLDFRTAKGKEFTIVFRDDSWKRVAGHNDAK